MTLTLPTKAVCPECERVFDMLDEDDAGEWFYGHDCEEPEPKVYDRPPNISFGATGTSCLDCGLRLILFDDDQHYCEVTKTDSEIPYDYDSLDEE